MEPSVFISYCHADEELKNLVVAHLSVLAREGILTVWNDRDIKIGEDWLTQIEHHLNKCKVAVMLVSTGFLNSEFIRSIEVQQLLSRRQSDGLQLLPLVIKPCYWQAVDWLAKLQLHPLDGKPLSKFRDRNEPLVSFAKKVHQLIGALENEVSVTVEVVAEINFCLKRQANGNYVATSSDVPLFLTQGQSLLEAIERMPEAMKKVIEYYASNGKVLE